MMMVAGLALGAAVGMVLGLTGAGGGILAIPALTAVLGFSMAQARPIALIAIGVAALLGCLDAFRDGNVRYRAATCIALVGAFFAPLGVRISSELPQQWLVWLFATLMIFLSLRMALPALRSTRVHALETNGRTCQLDTVTGRLRWTRKCALALGTLGAVTGLFTGLFGVGGGFVVVPGLNRASNIGMHASAATSLMVIAIVSTVSAVGILLSTSHVAPTGWAFVGMATVGTWCGRKLAHRIPARLLAIILSVAMVLAAVAFLLRMT